MLSCAGVGVGYSWLGWVVQLVCTCVAWTSTDQFNPVYILTYNIYTYIHTHTHLSLGGFWTLVGQVVPYFLSMQL